jgi:glycosyltransferase involved in cell wall biosynthesis
MKVAIDVSSLAREELTGIGVYIRHLVAGVAAEPGIDLRAVYRPRLHAKRELIARHIAVPAERFVAPFSSWGIDLYHGPDFRLPRLLGSPSVVTVHDLAVFEDGLLEESFARQGREKITRLIERRRPDAIIAVSEFTRDRIVELFPPVAERVVAIPLGFDPAVVATTGELPAGLERPFILYLGTIERRKNVAAVVGAFEMLRERSSPMQLAIAGVDGFDAAAVHAMIDASPHREAIHRLGFVDDATRAALLDAAEAFVYPSLYEGFGLPVVEAMGAGCPVVTSNVGAVAEVAGRRALTVAPIAEEIAAAIGRIIDDPALRATLIEAGRHRAAELTWSECIRRTLDVYRRVASK